MTLTSLRALLELLLTAGCLVAIDAFHWLCVFTEVRTLVPCADVNHDVTKSMQVTCGTVNRRLLIGLLLDDVFFNSNTLWDARRLARYQSLRAPMGWPFGSPDLNASIEGHVLLNWNTAHSQRGIGPSSSRIGPQTCSMEPAMLKGNHTPKPMTSLRSVGKYAKTYKPRRHPKPTAPQITR